ncbi:MAG: DUF1592 domain-containing protein [Planctomycetota bacterium]
MAGSLVATTERGISAPLPDATEDGRAVIELVCAGCHDGGEAEAGFDIARLLAAERPAEHLFDWRRAAAMIESGAMPPPRRSGRGGGLDGDERAAALAFLAAVEREALALGGAAGAEPARRLTRDELAHALRDLLGVEVDVSTLMPPELVTENGFDTNGATLFVHGEWLERADVAVRVAVDAAVADGKASGEADAGRGLAPTAIFLRRAFRRPPTPEELERYDRLRASSVEAGASEAEAQRAVLRAVLSSPHFRLRLEDVPPEPPAAAEERDVSPHGLASRLSFFLWAGPPDDRLLDLADSGALADHEVLAEEAQRLLADPRALRFARRFAGQWLGTRRVGRELKPDPIDNPAMTDSLMADMREEVARFLLALVREGAPLDALLLGEESFVTGELARFYGLDHEGEGLARVEVPAARRGLFGKAAVLAATSYPDRTSPVLRGAWILDDLLGTPPPPPPPGASEFEEDAFEEAEERGARALLERHRGSPACASCHDRIDPLGFALDGFDRFGRERRRDDFGHRVEASGRLPGGPEFSGPDGLSEAILEHRRTELAREVVRRMLRFSLGRSLEWSDERTVVELAAVLEARGFGALVRSLVTSRPFTRVAPR